MRLAFSTRPFSDRSLTEAIRTLGDAGYAGVEIVADFPHAFPEHVTPAVLDLVRTAVEEERLRVAALNAVTMSARSESFGPSWVDPDPSVRQQRLRYTLDCIRMGWALGADLLVTPAGGPWRRGGGVPEARAHEWFEHGLRRAIPVAEEFGVTLLVEAGPGLLLETSLQLRHFLRRIEHASIQASLEAAHAYCVGEEPAEAVRLLGSRIRLVHVSDVPVTREHLRLVPGRGAVDFAALAGALRDMRYRGFVSVDLDLYDETPDAAAAESLDVLRGLGWS